mmetsp:Transcript_30124/g.84134  ORF Transcript_30124/g.84134 Transcript_30124/m.84134 type:complete len:348 (+) Transcript_30124:380-1423(+)
MTVSPGRMISACTETSTAVRIMPAREVFARCSTSRGLIPRCASSLRAAEGSDRMATTCARGRYLAMNLAVSPESDTTTMRATSCSRLALTALRAMASLMGRPAIRADAGCSLWYMPRKSSIDSALRQTSFMISTAFTGYLPLAVSPLSITQSAPSTTALPTSDTSARVGRGLCTMDSSICVATITGLPARLHLATTLFCTANTSCAGISMPRSPRATMIPSLAAMMASTFSTPSWFSILDITMMCCPASPSAAFTSSTWEALRMKLAKMKSTPIFAPNSRSRRSFSETAGSVTMAPGRLTPFFSPRAAVFTARHLTPPGEVSSTCRLSSPSSMKTLIPGLTTFGRSL